VLAETLAEWRRGGWLADERSRNRANR